MPTEYFEQRERALLGERFDALYAAPQETAERGVTVSALRTTPEQFAAKADFSLEASPFCKAAFVVHQPDFKPGRHPYHHAGVFYSQEPSASSAAPLLGVRPGMRVLDMCAAPGGKSSQLALPELQEESSKDAEYQVLSTAEEAVAVMYFQVEAFSIRVMFPVGTKERNAPSK